MTDKTIQELAQSVDSPVEKLLEQVRAAGLPQRNADDVISSDDQQKLAQFNNTAGGKLGAGKITLKRKTTGTANLADSSGRTKKINVEVRKKQTFVKPDPAQLAADAEAKLKAEAEQKAQVNAKAKQVATEKAQSQKQAEVAENKAKATLDAMRANHGTEAKAEKPKAAVVVKKKSTKVEKPTETEAEKKAREAQAAQLKATEEATRRKESS